MNRINMNTRISRNFSPQTKPENSKRYGALSLVALDLPTVINAALRLLQVTFQLNLNVVWFWNLLNAKNSREGQNLKKSNLRRLSSTFLDASECSDLDEEEIESEGSWGQFVELTDEPQLVPCLVASK